MRLYTTVNDIQNEMQALYRNLTGKDILSASDQDVVYGSIVDAMQFVLLECGVNTFQFQAVSVDVDTVDGQVYVDLPEYTYRIVTGSVRIPANDKVLALIDELSIFNIDPGASSTGIPSCYSYGISPDDPNVMRVGLWPIPDGVYTITMKTLILPEDDLENFPSHLSAPIKYKAKELSCVGLGLNNSAASFRGLYYDIMSKIKDGHSDDGPVHVQRRINLSGGHYYGERRVP